MSSVPQSKRKKNKLEVAVRAVELEKHTLELTSNEKMFDRKHATLVLRIEDVALGIGRNIWAANNVKVDSPEDLALRRSYQDAACACCTDLLHLINLAKRTFHLRRNSAHHWASMAVEVRSLCRKWKESDSRRYGDS